jgi:hypothetical protein
MKLIEAIAGLITIVILAAAGLAFAIWHDPSEAPYPRQLERYWACSDQGCQAITLEKIKRPEGGP